MSYYLIPTKGAGVPPGTFPASRRAAAARPRPYARFVPPGTRPTALPRRYGTVTRAGLSPPVTGVGAIASSFDGEKVFADAMAGSAGDVGRGKKANEMIAAALNELGYGPVPLGGTWAGSTEPKFKQFMADQGLTYQGRAAELKKGLIQMEQLLQAGEVPGPNEPEEHEVVGGEVVPTVDEGFSTAGLLVLGLVGVGAIAFLATRKKDKDTTVFLT